MGPKHPEGERRRLPDSNLYRSGWEPNQVPLSMDDLPDVEKTFDFTDGLFEVFYGQAG